MDHKLKPTVEVVLTLKEPMSKKLVKAFVKDMLENGEIPGSDTFRQGFCRENVVKATVRAVDYD
jgi:hypothetical protein